MNREDRFATLEGRITGFQRENLLAVVETEFGEALLDINSGHAWPLKLGDEISIENAGFYICNGRIITVLGEKVLINGLLVIAPEDQALNA